MGTRRNNNRPKNYPMSNTRTANFSSSAIYQLMSKGRGAWSLENVGASFHTYVKEKRMEKRLGRSVSSEATGKAANWGTFLEHIAFDKMPLTHTLVSKKRYKHNSLPWTGAPDNVLDSSPKVVGDIKCPFTMKSFCELVDVMQEGVEAFKAHSPMYYWQLVSNAVLTDSDIAELWVYCPYKTDLDEIREAAYNYDGDQNKVAFINWASDEELPYLIEGNHYEDLNHFSFPVSKEDKELLTKRVEMATQLLNK